MTPFFLLALILLVMGGGLITLMLLERIRGLDRQLDALRKKVRALEDRERVASRPSPAVEKAAAPEPAAPVAEVPSRQAEPEPEPGPEPGPAPGPGPAPERAPVAATTSGGGSGGGIDWERWVGIRGAAVVGSIALVLAGLFFVQVAIERGWLGPAARDLLALGVGALTLVAHGPLRARKLHVLADSVAGAGTVLMYGGAWAAARLHDLVPPTIALLVMGATTGTALLLSLRASAPILASFALVGGFATPVLLGTLGKESTATLFGYVLVLDLALIALHRLRGWVAVLPAAIVGTTILQLAWSETNLAQPAPTWLVGLIGLSSAVLFTSVATDRQRQSELNPWVTLIALGVPFLMMGRQLMTALPPGTPLWMIAAFAGLLCCTAAVAARSFGTAFYLVGSAISSTVLLAGFRMSIGDRYGFGDAAASVSPGFERWTACTLALGLLLSGLAAWAERKGHSDAVPGAARASAAPYAFVLVSIFPGIFFGRGGESPAEWMLFGVIGVLALMGCHASRFATRGQLPAALVGLVAGTTFMVLDYRIHDAQDVAQPFFWGLPAFGMIGAIAALLLRSPWVTRFAAALSSMAAFVSLPAFVNALERTDAGPVGSLFLGAAAAATTAFATAWAVGEKVHVVATRLRHFALLLGSLGTVMLMAFLVSRTFAPWRYAYFDTTHPTVALTGLGALLGALPAAATVRARRTFRSGDESPTLRLAKSTRWVSWVTVLPMLYLLTRPAALGAMLWASSRGHAATTESLESGALQHSLLLGGAVLASLIGWATDRADRRAAVGAFSVASVLAVSILARELSSHPSLVTWALAAGAVALLSLRADLDVFVKLSGIAVLTPVLGLLMLTFSGRAFVATEALLPLQLTIDFGMVTAGSWCVGVALDRMHQGLVNESEPSESIVALRYAIGAGTLALLFGWMNAAVLNRFAEPGEAIRMMNGRLQARDLSLSISWGVFAGGLLAWGMVRRSATLRWTSLCLFVAFILKVFLYDLGALTGLARVGSFLGLAVALLSVSLLYARVLGEGARDGKRQGN